MEFEDDHYSTSSTSSSSINDNTITKPNNPSPPISHKRKAGRKKFKETRHPIYNGVRRRNGRKWVCEIREPNKKSRIWLGTFPTPEMAARAHDVATLALRGETDALNFADSAWLLKRAKSSSAKDIRIAALEAAMSSSSSSPACRLKKDKITSSTNLGHVKRQQIDLDVQSKRDECVEGSNRVLETLFVDEEALFNMPGFIDSMAEGMLLTPPAMERGFNWGDMDGNIDLTLWRD